MPPPAADPSLTSPAAESDPDKVEPGRLGFTAVALMAALTWVPAKRRAAGFRRPDRAGLPRERPAPEPAASET